MRGTFLLVAAAAATISTAAVAQPDFNRPPSFGTIELSSGFDDDPRVIDVTAGGRLNAATIDSSCVGSVANSPDVRLMYEAGELPLIISAASEADTTLVINGPDGSWYCDDDSGEGSNPSVRFADPQSGRYDIYVGHYQQGRSIPARLYISELGSQ